MCRPARIATVILALAAGCGGAPGPASPAPDRASRARPPAMPPRPAPAPAPTGVVVAAGEPIAAFLALEQEAHDLFARPEPRRLRELVVAGTRLHRQWEARLRALVRAGRAERQPGSTVTDVEVATDTDEVVSLRVSYRDTVHETLDAHGRVVAVEPMVSASHWVVVLRRDRAAGAARWWFVAIDRSVSDLEVVL